MTHYEVLGVSRTADAAEIRRAYVALARTHHPDFHTADGPSGQAAAAERMRAVNEAWRVLSDPERRRAYDLRTAAAGSSGSSTRGARADRPENSTGPGWVPPDDDDDWDPSMLDDTPTNGVKTPTALALAPFGLFAAGVLCLVVGFVVSAGLTAIGLILIVFSGIAFFVVPFLTMAESRRRDLEG